MARFRGTIQGSRGEASRLGDKKSGLRVDANGWHVGGQIIMDAKGDTDYVTFYVTSGSNGRQRHVHLATARLNKDGNYIIEINPALIVQGTFVYEVPA